MTKDQEQKLVDLRVRMALKQRDLENANPDEMETNQLDEITAEIEQIKKDIETIEAEIAETDKAEEQKAEEEKEEEEAIKNENEDLIEEERKKNMTNQELRAVRLESNEVIKEQVEARAKAMKDAFRERRSVTVASSNILLPNHQDGNVEPAPFQQVSSFVDMVNVKDFNGGETHEVPFTKSYGTGGLTNEGETYTTAETEFGNALISKVKITAIAEYSEEVEKLPAADYVAEIEKGVEIAIKKKVSEQIIAGAGTTNTFKGIISGNLEALENNDSVNVSAITDKTLDEIIYTYGGDEEVLGGGALVLNKLDLKKFATLRNTDGTKTYEVDYKAKTIDGIPYIINSNLPSLDKASDGGVFMLYGSPKGYEVDVFGPIEIMKSYDEKFSEGKIRIKASVFAGGNVTQYRSFVLVKKGTATE